MLHIACYNIAHGRGLAESNWGGGTRAGREQRLDDIASLLRELDADVVVLNECDFDASWSQSVDQAAYLAQQAGYPHIATLRNLDFRVGLWTWRFGNAVLSRHPIIEAREIDQPGYAKWETAMAGKKRTLFCEIEIGGERVGIAAVHLSHRSEELRVDSAQNLVNFAKFYDHPLILAVDFNSTPTGFPGSQADQYGNNAMDVIDALGLFQRRPEQPPTDPADFTFRSDNPTRVIDWVLLSNHFEIADYRIIDSPLSDHRPIVAEVRIK
ncbi:MAG: endonuclease/exonuclease/phosphatase family protein [Planctomycetota bacterium]